MAALLRVLLFLFIFSDPFLSIQSLRVGINYDPDSVSNSTLLSPSRVASHLQSLEITRVKIAYHDDPTVLHAFANTQLEVIIELGNDYLQRMAVSNKALKWIKQHIQPHINHTKIKGITIGNNALVNDFQKAYLLLAMTTISGALTELGLNEEIFVTTISGIEHILSNTFPPSAGAFRQEYTEELKKILNFQEQTNAPFLIEASPFRMFNYKFDFPEYDLFEPNPGKIDPETILHYNNGLYEQIDSVYSAMRALGYADIEVVVSWTGWPSQGPREEGFTPENAGLYIANLLDRMQENEGTPAKPDIPVDVFVVLFNETIGLYHCDGMPVYRLGLLGSLPGMDMDYSAPPDDVRMDMDYSAPPDDVTFFFFLYVLAKGMFVLLLHIVLLITIVFCVLMFSACLGLMFSALCAQFFCVITMMAVFIAFSVLCTLE